MGRFDGLGTRKIWMWVGWLQLCMSIPNGRRGEVEEKDQVKGKSECVTKKGVDTEECLELCKHMQHPTGSWENWNNV